MDKKCLLEEQVRFCSRTSDCRFCGWNPEEAKQREKLVAAHKLTTCEGGIKKLIIKRKVSDE